MLKMRWRPGLRPGPRWGAYRAPPGPLAGKGGGAPQEGGGDGKEGEGEGGKGEGLSPQTEILATALSTGTLQTTDSSSCHIANRLYR